MSLIWRATYTDGSAVHSAACRWAELDRKRLARFAVYAQELDAIPALEVDVPVGYRVMQWVRNVQGGGHLARVGMVALEDEDRTDVTVWTMPPLTKHAGYSPTLYPPALAPYDLAVRVA